jgi:hypothetical protein
MATTSKNRTTLVNGCGTILKTNRLKGGYKLVKRKKSKLASAPKKAKAMASAPATAPLKRKKGRPAKIKVTEVIKEKVVMTAPSKSRGKRISKKSVKA